jgi:hypothetical protein
MIRHLWSLVAGLVAAPVAFLLISLDLAYVQVRLTGDPQGFQLNFARLVAVGIVLGAVATLKISPVGPMVAGALLLTPTTIGLFSPDLFLQIFQDTDFQIGLVGIRPVVGAGSALGVALGALMLMAGASPSRWKGPAAEPAAVAVPELAPVDPAGPADREPAMSAAQLGQQWAPPNRV